MTNDETPDRERLETTDSDASPTEDLIDDAFDSAFQVVRPRGVPETSQNYDCTTEYQEWFNSLRYAPRTDAFDDAALTAGELCTKWRCNLVSLRRVLERYDLIIEHKGIQTRTGTYRELSRQFIAEGFAETFLITFFDLVEDGLFRARDVAAFERSHPEVMIALRCNEATHTHFESEQGMGAPVSADEESSCLTIIEGLGPGSISPDVPTLMTKIEEYAKDHSPSVLNKAEVDIWCQKLTLALMEKYPAIRIQTIYEALERWGRLGSYLRGRSGFYALIGELKKENPDLQWQGRGASRGPRKSS